jgi:hypothetical protein
LQAVTETIKTLLANKEISSEKKSVRKRLKKEEAKKLEIQEINAQRTCKRTQPSNLSTGTANGSKRTI